MPLDERIPGIQASGRRWSDFDNVATRAMRGTAMRSVNVAELKNQMSKYLALAQEGEEIVIRDRNLPVAMLVPFSGKESSEEELLLVAARKMWLPKETLDVEELLKIRTGKVTGNEAVRALLEDRSESLMSKVPGF
jgi:prevent-host-death family protein